MKGKSKGLQKLLRYFSGIVKVGTGCCAGRSASPGSSGCGGCAVVFPTIFILHLNDLPSEALSLTPSIGHWS